MAEVILIVRLVAAKGKEAELKAAMAALAGPTRAEPESNVYEPYASDTAGRFFFYERWPSQAALDAHMQTPYLKAFMARTDLFAEPMELNYVSPLA